MTGRTMAGLATESPQVRPSPLVRSQAGLQSAKPAEMASLNPKASETAGGGGGGGGGGGLDR